MSDRRFFTMLDPRKKVSSSSGRKELENFAYLPDPETGEEVLKVVGSDDLYLKAQLSRPDDLYTLLEKTGVSPSKVDDLRVTKEYAETLVDDFSSAPRTLLEAHEVIHKAQRSFDQLPLNVKQEFDNSSAQMLRSLIDGSFEERVAKFVPVKEDKSDEVK